MIDIFCAEFLVLLSFAFSLNHCRAFFGTDFFPDLFPDNDRAFSNGTDGLRVLLYAGNPGTGQMNTYSYSVNRPEGLLSQINLRNRLVLYIHGYQERVTDESVQTVVRAYLQKGIDSIAVLDWSDLAAGNYITVSQRTRDVAREASRVLSRLVMLGFNVSNIHVVGHSLGGQIAGFIGGYLDFRLPRVTALDPAYPMFYQFGAEHIDRRSAMQVDVIHTDAGVLGALDPTGSIDFYANGGTRPQPGCSLFTLPLSLSSRSLCSHWKAWRYFAESVTNERAFPAVQCYSYKAFLLGRCRNNEVVYFGYPLQRNASGIYFFNTNRASPYGRGLGGI